MKTGFELRPTRRRWHVWISCRGKAATTSSVRTMSWSKYAEFLAFAAVLVLIPGPDFAVVTKNTLVGGQGQGPGRLAAGIHLQHHQPQGAGVLPRRPAAVPHPGREPRLVAGPGLEPRGARPE